MGIISIDEIRQQIGNIYEAVVIMCRRARQVNDEQKLQIEMERDVSLTTENRESEDLDEVEIDREALMKEHKKYPKPSRIALEELVEDKLKFHYNQPSEEENKQ